MSVVILYRGQRKTFKCGSAPMKSTVDEAVQHFKINSSLEFHLTHKNKKVDLSTPFRLSSIPNNAVLELVCGDKRANSGSDAETRLAVSCDSGFGNLAGKFRSDMTLLEVLSSFVDQGSLPAPLIDPCLNFTPPLEVIYLRQRFQGLESLQACTLASLGLGGSSARLQLRVPTGVKDVPKDIGTSVDACIPSTITNLTSSCADDSGKNRMAVVNEDLDTTTNKVDGFNVEAKGVDKVISSLPPLPANVKCNADLVQDNQDNVLSLPTPYSTSDMGSFSISVTTDSVHEAVTAILSANFDAVSEKAITTVLKYLDNLIKYPDRSEAGTVDATLAKYRTINLSNQIVRENILHCHKGLELLYALGFVGKQCNSVPTGVVSAQAGSDVLPVKLEFGFTTIRQDWELNPDTLCGYTLQRNIQGDDGAVLVSSLLAARDVLCSALSDMSAPSSPSTTNKTSPLSTLALLQSIARKQAPMEDRAMGTVSVVEFDPFKPFIMRASDNKMEVKPTPSGRSNTTTKLDQLTKRRRELEGDRYTVQRLTQVSIKGSNVSTMASDKVQPTLDDSEETDGQIQARALKQKLMKMGNTDVEGPALTTRALKELEKAQKTVVYSQTLIKVIFPDKVCLQGYFHPRDTVEDIAKWLRTECFMKRDEEMETSADTVRVSSLYPHYDFDLYTSPPRRSLFSQTIGSSEGDVEKEVTLYDLSLVPAAVIHVSWQGASALDHVASGMPPGATYLSQTLLDMLRGDFIDDSAQLTRGFPNGQRLVPESAKDVNAADEKLVSNRGGTQDLKSAGESGRISRKPKWFKL